MEMHLEVKVVGKGTEGRTACGSSAYRSCDRVVDNTGRVHDYRRKSGHVLGGIELPKGAPEDLRNRQTLWSRHELRDVRKDAELFREIVIGLPNELSYETCASILQRLSQPLTEKGMCVQWDIHDTTNDGKRNLHAHLMVTMRTLQPDGTFGNKDRSWNRYNGGLNIAEMLRPEAARMMNEELAAIGSALVVEHESFVARGIDKLPQKHMGVAATAMERKGVRTNKGRWNQYIDWLNKIHADNLRQVETQTPTGRLEDLIAGARMKQDGKEAFKDWDALFAMLRDARRCRAAMNSELGKIGKVISAYEEGNASYLRWAGCDPESQAQKLALQTMQDELRIGIKQMDVTEEFLLDSKELLKAHNKVIYTSNKVAWDQYQISRKERSMAYCLQRIDSIESYMSYLTSRVSMFDAIFNTQAYKDYCATMAELERQKQKMKEDYARNRAELKQNKKDLKEHQREAKKAEKNEKKVQRQVDR